MGWKHLILGPHELATGCAQRRVEYAPLEQPAIALKTADLLVGQHLLAVLCCHKEAPRCSAPRERTVRAFDWNPSRKTRAAAAAALVQFTPVTPQSTQVGAKNVGWGVGTRTRTANVGEISRREIDTDVEARVASACLTRCGAVRRRPPPRAPAKDILNFGTL